MVNFCAVLGCSNRSNREKDTGYYRIPAIVSRSKPKKQALSVEHSVASPTRSSLLIRASQVARRSSLKACFLGFHLDTIAGIRQYPLCFSVLERFEQPSTAQKFTITRKLQDSLQIGPRTHTICFDACPPLREIT